MNPRTQAPAIPVANAATVILVAAGAAALGASSSAADGWTVSNCALIALALCLITRVFDAMLTPALPGGWTRGARLAFAGLFAVMAIASILLAFHAGPVRI